MSLPARAVLFAEMQPQLAQVLVGNTSIETPGDASRELVARKVQPLKAVKFGESFRDDSRKTLVLEFEGVNPSILEGNSVPLLDLHIRSPVQYISAVEVGLQVEQHMAIIL